MEPEELLEVRIREQPDGNQQEVLIKWQKLPPTEATWEDLTTINHLFPSFHLKD